MAMLKKKQDSQHQFSLLTKTTITKKLTTTKKPIRISLSPFLSTSNLDTILCGDDQHNQLNQHHHQQSNYSDNINKNNNKNKLNNDGAQIRLISLIEKELLNGEGGVGGAGAGAGGNVVLCEKNNNQQNSAIEHNHQYLYQYNHQNHHHSNNIIINKTTTTTTTSLFDGGDNVAILSNINKDLNNNKEFENSNKKIIALNLKENRLIENEKKSENENSFVRNKKIINVGGGGGDGSDCNSDSDNKHKKFNMRMERIGLQGNDDDGKGLSNSCGGNSSSGSSSCNSKNVIGAGKMNLSSRKSLSLTSSSSSTFIGLVAVLMFLMVFNHRIVIVMANNDDTSSKIVDASLLHGFSKVEVIRPTLQHTRHKRDISTTKLEDGMHADQITLRYESQGNDVIIDLHLNDNLIPDNHFLRYQTPNGGKIVQNFTKTDIDHCHYQGTIRGKDNSRAAISTCNGIKGIVYVGDETFYINTKPNGVSINDEHFLYRHSDMNKDTPFTCGYDRPIIKPNITHQSNETINLHKINEETNRILRSKRSATTDTIIRGPYNANKHSSFVELVLVVDNKLYQSLGENLKTVHSHCKDIANIIYALYVPLNIFIALVGIVVWNENNEVPLVSNGDTTLTNFLSYRRKSLVKDHPNDNAQLLTKTQFDGGVVGKALKGPMCTYEYSGGVSTDHSPIVAVVATTVAHEMGHNFGMEHDNDDCKCPDDRCIMSASSSSVAPLHWSSCSVDQLNLAFHQGMNYCLRNKPTKLFESPLCGNGFVEPGEQCDCGLPKFCENTCCDPYTCMLQSNASCATGACCDLNTCHPKTAGTVCRMAEGECDLPEYCSGESEYCPADYFKRNTEPCDNNSAYCYEGTCRSHDDQCKILWGPSGKSSEQCYTKNVDGTRHGNCGFKKLTNTYLNCSKEDQMCGMLQCSHLNERLEYGMESASIQSHSFIPFNGKIIPCRTVIVDLGLQSIDPGLTPNGAKCGDDKMCVDQKCLSLYSLRVDGFAPLCPENCSGHGICDNKGNCHCDAGFAPPLCDQPGYGGSEFSGPATNPNDGTAVVRIMYIFFLGVVPFISLVLILIYYFRQNRPMILRKSANVVSSINWFAWSDWLKSNNNTKNAHHGNGSSGGGGGGGGNKTTTPISTGGITSTPSSTDDMNSALLRTTTTATATTVNENESSKLNNNMFGHFKGFTLKPLPTRTPNIAATNVALVHPVGKYVDDNASGIVSNGVPQRIAPPVPKPPTVVNSTKQNMTTSNNNKPIPPKSIGFIDGNNEAPALPPFNPGSTARPLISSPILEASTCSAKELISPLRHNAEKYSDKYPIRQAPAPPPLSASNSFDSGTTLSRSAATSAAAAAATATTPPIKVGTINRIASFLKKEDKTPAVVIKPKPLLDKEKLKNIEISSPITPPIAGGGGGVGTMSDDDEEPTSDRSFISRTQSMREPTTTSSTVVKRVQIPTFGSMRHPGGIVKRPGSIVGSGGGGGGSANSRPKSPPPPRPPAPPSIVGYQNPPPPKKVIIPSSTITGRGNQNLYDDCEAIEIDNEHKIPAPLAKINEDISPTGSDNIYSVIDEYQRPKTTTKPVVPINNSNKTTIKTNTTTNPPTTDDGLLSEIVSEIENRNLNSIYSTSSTLSRKKSNDNNDTSALYTNTADIDDSGDDYSNNKSNLSTTSSGYLRPTGINAPIARVAPVHKPQMLPPKPLITTADTTSTVATPTGSIVVNTPAPIIPITNNLSSFKRKPTTATSDDTNNKSTKPIIAPEKPKLSTTVSKTSSFNRTKTPPSLQTNKLRTRSPSPAAKSINKPSVTTAVGSGAAAGSSSGSGGGGGGGGASAAGSYKPKWQTNTTTSNINRNNPTTKPQNDITKRVNGNTTTTAAGSGNNGTVGSGNTNKNAGGVTTIALLQKKFENSNDTKLSGSGAVKSSKGGAITPSAQTTLKK